jgi:hypothetical protein
MLQAERPVRLQESREFRQGEVPLWYGTQQCDFGREGRGVRGPRGGLLEMTGGEQSVRPDSKGEAERSYGRMQRRRFGELRRGQLIPGRRLKMRRRKKKRAVSDIIELKKQRTKQNVSFCRVLVKK